MLRTHNLGEIDKKLAGKKVKLCGWIDSIRILKSVIFIVLRDRYGKVQAVVSEKSDFFGYAKKLTNESCVMIEGSVKKAVVPIKASGVSPNVEIDVQKMEVFNLSPKLPFEFGVETTEDIRLKNRFLDLRSDRMQKNVLLRSEVINAVLEFFHEEGFVYFETPILAKSTPEGARDYLVPSRNYPGEFYALPQSPQLFKQLSQVAGFDKYIQLARCFRDEDLRKDRQPEFTQVDVEMSFVEQDDVIDVIERLMKYVFKKVLNVDVKIPFKRITYDEAMKKYKRDNPDLRKKEDEFAFCWVVGFPCFEYSADEKRYKSVHHPFTMPITWKDKLDFNEKSKSFAYDIVLNGSEIGGGSIRIHNPETQEKVFDILKISKKEAEKKFGFLLNALKYGAPPHGGIALGLDRLVQLILREDNIREVIPFPKNKESRDVMLDAPSEIDEPQLKELGLKLEKKK